MKRSAPLESHMYGDPMKVLERKQAQEAREKREGRRTLHVKPGWSDARKAAEALFSNFAAEGVLPSDQRTPSNSGRPEHGED